MSARTYVDTMVFVFHNDARPEMAALQAAAEDFLAREAATGRPTIGVNVLGETYVQLVRPRGAAQLPLLGAAAAARVVDAMMGFRVVAPDGAVYAEAVRLASAHRRGFWDSLHLATARAHGCDRIASDDVPDPEVLEGVRYVNPFEGVARPAMAKPRSQGRRR